MEQAFKDYNTGQKTQKKGEWLYIRLEYQRSFNRLIQNKWSKNSRIILHGKANRKENGTERWLEY